MLIKSDLSEIRKIVREEVENETHAIKDELQSDITMSRMRIQQDINELTDRTKNLEIRITKMHTDLRNEVKMVSHFLDKENMETVKRVEKIEDNLGLTNQAI